MIIKDKIIILVICIGMIVFAGCNLFSSREDSNISARESISLLTKGNLNRAGMMFAVEDFRKAKNLRQLLPREAGKSVSETPAGTYFFVSPYYIETDSVISTKLWEQGRTNWQSKYHLDYYEIHYDAEKNVYLVAMTTEKFAKSISHLDGKTQKQVTLSPVPWTDDVDTLVAIPYNRILSAKINVTKSEENEDMYLLDMVIQ